MIVVQIPDEQNRQVIMDNGGNPRAGREDDRTQSRYGQALDGGLTGQFINSNWGHSILIPYQFCQEYANLFFPLVVI